MPSYKLIYFNAQGRAENIRYMFAESGTEYEDFRIEIKDWPAYKTNTPFGQVPILEIDGNPLPQSCSIMRYLAREFNLEPETSLEKAYADMMLETLMEASAGLPRMSEKEQKERLKTKVIPAFEKFEKAAKAEKDAYFFGKKFSYADIVILNFGTLFSKYKSDLLDSYPKLKELVKRVSKRPKIAAWIEKRPAITQF